MSNLNIDNKTFPEMEDAVLSFWEKNNIFLKSVEQNSADNLYVFYDGPPFISGLPHYGHLLGSIAKDVIPRYWTMQGKRVERLWGWDAHGLTVENKVQKELGIKSRRDIENYGLEKFTQAAYSYTSRISAEWDWYINKIGRWVDIKNAYKTIDQNYMESVMWAFKELYTAGFIYEGTRTSLFCTTCGTPVSNFEIAMDNSYKDVEDPAVTVKFTVTTDGKYYKHHLLAWTTTPWTLPSNRALVVNAKEKYSVVVSGNEKYILGSARVSTVFKGVEYSVEAEILGSDLVGLCYDPIYTFYKSKDNEFKVYSYEGMVTMEEGTGIVHSAPGFGEIDTEMGKHFELTLMMTIDAEGKFIQEEGSNNPFAGFYYKKADKYIIEDLINRNLLFKNERILHRFPYHDRCDTLLIQKSQNSWFLDVQRIKSELLKNNEVINWVPGHLKNGRFYQGIEQAPDWCISRNRFWATPMPIWESPDGDRIVISSRKELEELSGQPVLDLHRPYIDNITITKDGKVYKRRPEVLDSWFEAGSMPYAQLHYPFENKEKFEKNFPGDYIVEYIGQVRAWFYVMHVLSTALFKTNSFRNVISTGVLAGNDGRKMSKTYGNYTDPKEVLKNVGGDALRLYLMGSPLMVGENSNFDDTELKNKSKNVLNPLWNSVKFFDMYAKEHTFKDKLATKSSNVLDLWLLSRLDNMTKEFIAYIESYNIPPLVRLVEDFVYDLSNWYVRRSRDRISSGDLAALSTFYQVLIGFSKVSAPLIPFISEYIYQVLKGYGGYDKESVHLFDYPKPINIENTELMKNMEYTKNICSAGNSLRKEFNIGVRQPLMLLQVKGPILVAEFTEIICDELNVKKVEFVPELNSKYSSFASKNFEIALDTTITPELELEGNYRSLVREIQSLRKEKGLNVGDRVVLTLLDSPVNKNIVLKYQKDLLQKVWATELNWGTETIIKSL